MIRLRVALTAVVLLTCGAGIRAEDPIAIGSRLEPMVDEYLIDSKTDTVALCLHRPEPREVVLVTDQPWEGNTSAYYTIIQDGDLLRMYYRGSHYNTETKAATHREVTCYAESKDGVHWTKPELGLFEFDGSRANNIVLDGLGTHCFTPFLDANPDCPPESRLKGLSRGRPIGKQGLYAFRSEDGISWEMIHDEPVITNGAFDSQNLAFWDTHRKTYVDYHRNFRDGVRDIMTCTSDDFLNWTEPVNIVVTGADRQHLYTNAVRNYPGAPHILIGFPTRFFPQTQQVEPTMMVSRDGMNFHRWEDALIPFSAPEDRDGNRSNYMANGLVELPNEPGMWSMYASEAYYTGPDSRLRRFAIRKDGFVSLICAGEGTVLTKPLAVEGDRLVLNYRCKEGGSIRVGVMNEETNELDGLSVDECIPLTADVTAAVVQWNDGATLSEASKSPLRLVIRMKDAELFSLRFAHE